MEDLGPMTDGCMEIVPLKRKGFKSERVSNSRPAGQNWARQVIACGPRELKLPYNKLHVAEFLNLITYFLLHRVIYNITN